MCFFFSSSVSTGLSVYTDDCKMGHYSAAGGEHCQLWRFASIFSDCFLFFFLLPSSVQGHSSLVTFELVQQEMCFYLSFLPNYYPGLNFPSHYSK